MSLTCFDYARSHQDRFLEELKDFLRIPSVSTQVEHRSDMIRTAVWIREKLLEAGFPRAEVMPTRGHPIIYAEWLAAGSEKPTVLIYGHYDVQPPEPFDLWHTPPFEPTVVDDGLFARGAADDKGQVFIHMKAMQAFQKTAGMPPVNIKMLIEGEEEIGSPSLDPFIREHQDLLRADVALISDSHILGKELPTIVYALRGMAYVEVEVTGPAGDLHSGIYGGAVQNPINALCAMVAKLQDGNGRILIPGFYDKVRDLEPEERAEMAKIPFDREVWLAEAGVIREWGEPGYTVIERTTARPTLDVNGIWGGYIQPGAKTVLPSKAFAKISMRLVPDQNHEEISLLIADYFQKIAPPAVSVEVRDLHGGAGAMVRRDSPAMNAAFRAYAAAFGREPIFVREGGSIPVVATFQKVLGIDTILMGFGLPDDNLHAPNEKFSVSNFYRGIQTSLHFLTNLAEL
ncbi:MAG: dipeptidase [Anaerolineae bacterium]|nr:dipeptidase [Anaerolineae bacterium]